MLNLQQAVGETWFKFKRDRNGTEAIHPQTQLSPTPHELFFYLWNWFINYWTYFLWLCSPVIVLKAKLLLLSKPWALLQFILCPFCKRSEVCFPFIHLLDSTGCLHQTGSSKHRPWQRKFFPKASALRGQRMLNAAFLWPLLVHSHGSMEWNRSWTRWRKTLELQTPGWCLLNNWTRAYQAGVAICRSICACNC